MNNWTDRVKNEVLHRGKEELNILYTTNEGKQPESVTRCLGTPFYNTLLKEILKGREEEKQDISSYCMTLRKTQDTGSEYRKHQIKLWRICFGRQYRPVARQTT